MPISPIIVALDYDKPREALRFSQGLDPKKVRLKVGKELFVTAGPAIIEQFQQLGFEIFLDLKFHDIPNTVAKACLAAAELGVWMTNVHASGGDPMMHHIMESLEKLTKRPLITAVTVLTSMDSKTLQSVGVTRNLTEQVKQLASLAKDCHLDGVVCSALEASMLRESLGKEFLLVTPGIRLENDNGNDQHRIMTPERALAAGSTHLVIGRPITQAPNPMLAIEEILERIT